jgi:hypothetical protein
VLNTANITYTGANLPNTGIDTGDNLNTVLQKIDEEFDPVTLVQTLLFTIQSNPSLQVAFCSLVNECVPTTTTTSTTTEAPTTTTSTSTSTTTTTTTAIPFMVAGALGATPGDVPFATSEDACSYVGTVANNNFYTPNGVLIANGVQLSQGEVYLGFTPGWYLYTYYDGDPIFPTQIFYLDSSGIVSSLSTCP